MQHGDSCLGRGLDGFIPLKGGGVVHVHCQSCSGAATLGFTVQDFGFWDRHGTPKPELQAQGQPKKAQNEERVGDILRV